MPYTVQRADGQDVLVLPGYAYPVEVSGTGEDPKYWTKRCQDAIDTGEFTSELMRHLEPKLKLVRAPSPHPEAPTAEAIGAAVAAAFDFPDMPDVVSTEDLVAAIATLSEVPVDILPQYRV